MPASSYQVERLIRQFRNWLAGDRLPPGDDAARVTVAPEAVRHAQAQAGANRRQRVQEAPAAPGRVIERTHREGPVEAELERRAGSFLSPPYEPDPPRRIPRVRRVRKEGTTV